MTQLAVIKVSYVDTIAGVIIETIPVEGFYLTRTRKINESEWTNKLYAGNTKRALDNHTLACIEAEMKSKGIILCIPRDEST